MEDVNGWDPQLTHLIDMWIRLDYGAGADTLSAACGFWNYTGSDYVRYKWPGGLSGFAFGSGNSNEPKPGVPIFDAGQRFGRIAFARIDLNGFTDNQGTTRISQRAVDDLLD